MSDELELTDEQKAELLTSALEQVAMGGMPDH
jgi:hypothetical protein